eukprot:6818344-Alexandrium_andersonii.AAC.1
MPKRRAHAACGLARGRGGLLHFRHSCTERLCLCVAEFERGHFCTCTVGARSGGLEGFRAAVGAMSCTCALRQ